MFGTDVKRPPACSDLIVSRRSVADGRAEREAAKAEVPVARQLGNHDYGSTLGADKRHDARDFIDALQQMNVASQMTPARIGRCSAVPDAIAGSGGHLMSRQMRKLIG